MMPAIQTLKVSGGGVCVTPTMLQRESRFRYPLVLVAYGNDECDEAGQDLSDRPKARQIVNRLIQRIAVRNDDRTSRLRRRDAVGQQEVRPPGFEFSIRLVNVGALH